MSSAVSALIDTPGILQSSVFSKLKMSVLNDSWPCTDDLFWEIKPAMHIQICKFIIVYTE